MGRQTTQFGGLSGRQMAMILGVGETRVNQAAGHALDAVAVMAMKNPAAMFDALQRRMRSPTAGMLEILRRRDALIEQMRGDGSLVASDLAEETFNFERALRKLTDRKAI